MWNLDNDPYFVKGFLKIVNEKETTKKPVSYETGFFSGSGQTDLLIVSIT